MRFVRDEWLKIVAPQSGLICSALFEGDGDGAGGTGDGAGGDGTGDGAAEGLSEAQSAAVNKIVSTHVSRMGKRIETEMGTTIGKALEPITASLAELKPAAEPEPEDDPASDDKESKASDKRIKAQQLKHQKEIDRLSKRADEAEAAKKAESDKAIRAKERGSLKDALDEAGLDPVKRRAAVALIYGEDKRIGTDDEGNVFFRMQRGTGKDAFIEEITVAEGVKEYLETDEGKSFLPATGAAGSGGKGSKHQRRTGPKTKAEIRQDARALLRQGHGFE